MRALGERAPGSYSEFATLATVKEATGTPSADDMVKILAEDQATVAASFAKVLEAAEKAGDDVSEGLATDRREVHEKNRWMLQSSAA